MTALHGIAAIAAAVALGSSRTFGKAEKAALGGILKTKAAEILDEWPRGSEALANAGFTKEQAAEQLLIWFEKIPGGGRIYQNYPRQ